MSHGSDFAELMTTNLALKYYALRGSSCRHSASFFFRVISKR